MIKNIFLLLLALLLFSACDSVVNIQSDTNPNTNTDSNTESDVTVEGFSVTYKYELDNEEEIIHYSKENVPLVLPSPSKPGYNFLGWYDNALYTGKGITSIDTAPTEDKTFHAKWSKITYSITYVDTQNATNLNATSYTVEDTVTLTKLTHPDSSSDYSFSGWYDNDSYSGYPINTIEAGSTENKRYYAKWDIEASLSYGRYNNDNNSSYLMVSGINNEDVATIVNVPESYAGLTVIGINDHAFWDNTKITELNIPDTVLIIGKQAFDGCTSLKTVKLGSQIIRLELGAFIGCSKLETINVPQSLSIIGAGAFSDCIALKTFYIPNTVSVMGNRVFSGNNTNIYIEHNSSEKPKTWYAGWNEDNSGTVLWNQTMPE